MIPLDGLLVNTEATPFVGLRSFTSDDAGIYFGREDEVREMISRLERGRFLAILGDSGVGKSSLVAAGLLPELTRGALTGRHSGWTMIRFQPGLDPILSLAEAVTASARQRRVGDDLNRTLRLSSLALAHLLADSARTSSTNILLFADQFEEIFAYQDDKHTPEARMEASLYVRLLLEACQFPDAPIYLLLTMRSEYLGRTIEFAALPEALNEGQYLVPQLREGLREAIVGPAAVRGASVSPGLVQVLLNEASKPGNLLPVLQHALMRTWVQARSRVETSGEPTFELRLEDYAGGVASSLQEHASDVIAALPPQNRELVRLVFQAITLKDLSGHIRRRPVSFDGLCRLVNASVGDLQPVLEAFSAPDCAMLTIRPTGPLTSTSTVDLTHESLIWKWPALARWIDEEARDASLFRDALEDARRYRNGEDSRWRGVRLAEGVAWQGQPHHSEEWATRYVRDATTLAEVRRFIAESKRREDRENTRARRQVWLLLFGCGALLVALLIFLKLANERKAANAKLRGLNDELALGKGNLAAAVEDLTKKEGALNEALRTLRSSRQALVDETKALGQAKRDLQDQNSQLRQQDNILKETDTARGVLSSSSNSQQ